jgi:2,3-bisphosphoglycerate-dependent phosphoglycerate mutase
MQLYFIRHAESVNNAIYSSSEDWSGRMPDPGLTAKGREQARLLADRLSRIPSEPVETARHDPRNANGFGVTHIYCSPMVRALFTGQVIADALELPLVVWEELHERGGIFDWNPETDQRIGLPGARAEELRAGFPQARFPNDWGADGWWNREPETDEQCNARAARLWDRLLVEHGSRTSGGEDGAPGDEGETTTDNGADDRESRIALISHAGFFQNFLHRLFARMQGLESIEVAEPFWFTLNNTAITRVDIRDWGGVLVYSNRIDHLPPELVTS